MNMMTNTLGRYFAGRFVVAAVGVFASIFLLLVLVDYIEMVRKTSGLPSASAITVAQTSLYRVPQLLEKMMPFCVLIGAMTCYLALSRRLELVVARAAGVSAWQFIAPALASSIALGILATIAYNPMSANLRELSKRMEAELFGSAPGGGIQDASGFWLNQVNNEGQWIINAARSEQQGVRLTGLTVFRFDGDLQFKERIETREATLEEGVWRNGVPARASPLTRLEEALVAVQLNFRDRQALRRVYPLLERAKDVRQFGTAAWEFAAIAYGGAEAYVDARDTLSPENYMAAYLLVRQAGGVITDRHGEPLAPIRSMTQGQSIVAACNPELHAAVLEALAA